MQVASEIKVFVPAEDIALSEKFYAALGFAEDWRTDSLIQFSSGSCRFLLQNFYDRQMAENLMLQLVVPNCEAWWAQIQSMDLSQFGRAKAQAPETQPWGQKILYLWDPGGVLWHIAEQIE